MLAVDDVQHLDAPESLAGLRVQNNGSQKMRIWLLTGASLLRFGEHVLPKRLPLSLFAPDVVALKEGYAVLPAVLKQALDGNRIGFHRAPKRLARM